MEDKITLSTIFHDVRHESEFILGKTLFITEENLQKLVEILPCGVLRNSGIDSYYVIYKII